MIKKVLSEQQKYLERMQREQNKNNVFLTGIPNAVTADMSETPNDEDDGGEGIINDHIVIIHHVLNFVYPGIQTTDYKIQKNFDPREGFTRHSAKISVNDVTTKKKIFDGCKKFKGLDREDYLKRVFIKNDDPPLSRQENDRLYQKMKVLREEEEDPRNPINKYHIKAGKLFKNGDSCLDEFNINNQLF